jgi:hypothetical protein
MARRPRATDAEQPTAILASAKRYKVDRGDSDPMKSKSTDSSWQRAAWHFFDVVGEYRFSCEWVGSQLSRAVLFATYDDGDGPKRVKEGNEADLALDTFFGGQSGQSQMLADVGIHYTVAGECYFVGLPGEDGEPEEWSVQPASKVGRDGGKWTLNGKPLPDEATVIRSWRPHPNDPRKANSPSRAALPILSEIERLTMHVAAQVDSRLASAGILFLPKEMTFSAEGVRNADGSAATGGSASTFVRALYDVMSTGIADRESASALVPIVITAEAEYLDKANLMTFWTDLDENAIELRKEALRRMGLSLDMPPEIVTGTGEMNHWGAWAVDEAAIKSHTEPLLMRIAGDITKGFLRPALKVLGLPPEEVRKYGVGIDTSEMRLRPNRSKEAVELWDRGELGTKAMLRETGFDPEDAPTEEERRTWLLRKIAQQTTTPEIVAEAARLLGLQLSAPSSEASGNEPTHDAPSLKEHPEVGPPDPEATAAAAQQAALEAAAEQMVFRALERAGNRLKSKVRAPKMPGVEAPELYLWHSVSPDLAEELLEGAWDRVARFASSLGTTAESLTPVLDSYCRVLLTEKKPHSRELLSQYLSLTKAAH